MNTLLKTIYKVIEYNLNPQSPTGMSVNTKVLNSACENVLPSLEKYGKMINLINFVSQYCYFLRHNAEYKTITKVLKKGLIIAETKFEIRKRWNKLKCKPKRSRRAL